MAARSWVGCGWALAASIAVWACQTALGAAGGATPAATIASDCLELSVGAAAENGRFLDRKTGVDYAARQPASRLAHVRKQGKTFAATKAGFQKGVLSLEFGPADVRAALRLTAKKRYIVVEVTGLSGEGVEEFTFVDIPLTTKGLPDEPFAACALALNLQTRVPDLPKAAGRLRASCFPRFGFVGSRVALIGCPQAELRTVMQEVVREAPELPHSPIGGPWALDGRNNYDSYLFNSSGVSAADVDDWIRLAASLGITQINFHGGHSFRFGDCEPNPKIYPEGRRSFKKVIDKLHAAGIQAGLHTYSFFMAKNCPYVTPTPDARLGKDAVFTLAGPLDAAATTVPVEETTEKMSSVTGFFVRNSVTLQIDEELITYGDVSQQAPYGFLKCRRGAHGTRVAAHARGAKVQHLRECFGLFVPDGDSTLLAEVAAKTAEMFNDCGFDMIYLDALDGEDAIAGRECGWHYGSKFVFEIWRRLKRPAIMEMSTFHHHLWYVRSRMGAWDHPTRSHKKFIDIHCEGNESCRRMFLPAHLGWWAFKTWNGAQGEPTFADDIEYLCGKALANDAGISIMGITPTTAPKTPALPRLAAIVKNYEELRRSRTVDESIKRELRASGQEFTLVSGPCGEKQFRRVVYDKHKVEGLAGGADRWTLTSRFGRQPVKLRLQALLTAGPYDAADNITLVSASDLAAHRDAAGRAGITARLERSTEHVKIGDASLQFTAANATRTAQAAWGRIGRTFDPPANLTGREALGLWVHGDGQGEVLNVQLQSPAHLSHGIADHYIPIDFRGWKYFALIEPEGERHAQFTWPYGGIYSMYREAVRPGSIETVRLYYNNIPPGRTVNCSLSPLRALPTVKIKLRDPAITLGGRTIRFPVEIESGCYLEFRAADDCKLFGPAGELLREVLPSGEPPLLEPGVNSAQFTCQGAPGMNSRANVWIISEGDVLSAKKP